jgi:riboflavin kinase/FMN adenylyltransferase
VELHILDFSDDIYGEKLELFFIDRIREEIRFDNPESLADQVRSDVAQARTVLEPFFAGKNSASDPSSQIILLAKEELPPV